MKKAISYALFNADNPECHTFNTFMRFLPVTLRAHLSLFPDFEFVLHIDETIEGKNLEFIRSLEKLQLISLYPHNGKYELCRGMLLRLWANSWADYNFCRDLDSMPTYREAQAVDQYIRSGCMAHAMNDSISHTIPMMGGMIGFSKDFEKKYPLKDIIMDIKDCDINFNDKGSDQSFISRYIWPKVKEDIFCHRILGLDCSNDPHCVNVIPDVYLDIPTKLKDSNKLVNHIGQGGYHLEPTTNTIINKFYPGAVPFWREHCEENDIIDELEKGLPDIYYWHSNNKHE